MTLRTFFFNLLILLFCTTGRLSAQAYSADEYAAQVGCMAGGGFYIGDANTSMFKNTQPFGGFLFRYLINNRIALRAEAGYGTIKAATFSNNLYIGDLCGEYNFFDLEQNPYKRFSKTYSPYIFGGLSLMEGVYSTSVMPSAGLCFGVGFKYKLTERLNLNIQWSNRLMFVDNLEGTSASNTTTDIYNNYKGVNGSNIFNNDLYSSFSIGLTLDIIKKGCDCIHNQGK